MDIYLLWNLGSTRSNTSREIEIADEKKKIYSCSIGIRIYQERQDMKTYKEHLENYPQDIQENRINLSVFEKVITPKMILSGLILIQLVKNIWR